MDKYVKSVKDGLKDSIKFFGNVKKPQRELWVLTEFLSYIKPEFNADEIVLSKEEPSDVQYQEYTFQVKEVLSPYRRRHQEYKDKLASITEETTLKDTQELYHPHHVSLNEYFPYLNSELARHRIEKYKGLTSNMNMLVYLNLTGTTYKTDPVEYRYKEFQYWKSVSLVSNNNAIILACSETKNKLLYPYVGKIYTKN